MQKINRYLNLYHSFRLLMVLCNKSSQNMTGVIKWHSFVVLVSVHCNIYAYVQSFQVLLQAHAEELFQEFLGQCEE